MKEFGRPHGRFANISDYRRRQFFVEAAHLINTHKILSVGATLSTDEYRRLMPQKVREKFSVYAMCFLLSLMMNHKLAEHQGYTKKVSFILDRGNPNAQHVRQGHAMAMLWQKSGQFLHAGSLTFADDEDLCALQAADVIAWGVRRRVTGVPFGHAFSPIEGILDENLHHAEKAWTEEWLREVGESTLKSIERLEAAGKLV
jgi:hypothetical protein